MGEQNNSTNNNLLLIWHTQSLALYAYLNFINRQQFKNHSFMGINISVIESGFVQRECRLKRILDTDTSVELAYSKQSIAQSVLKKDNKCTFRYTPSSHRSTVKCSIPISCKGSVKYRGLTRLEFFRPLVGEPE